MKSSTNPNRLKALERYNANPSICKNCFSKIEVGQNERPHDAKRKRFCSHSCAASFNNKGKTRNPKIEKFCECGNPLGRNAKKCKPCATINVVNSRTLGETIGDGKYTCIKLNDVRRKAREVLNRSDRLKTCAICRSSEFDSVVEACHIKGVMDHPLDSLIGEINNLTNLIWLCPSHHKLYDKGYIKIA